ncbi:MAG: thioredoxin family protein [Magnetococcales bacterium]|nr:thioredoxin family protein [Magnetococcales bacterium]NGZ05324.1 thioredoxin family protein [Magnetococcales bacterium]
MGLIFFLWMIETLERRHRLLLLVILLALIWTGGLLAAPDRRGVEGQLVVFVTDFCPYCKDFMQTVAPVYPKTDLGQKFPLVVVDNFAPPKEWEAKVWEVRFYPTFLLMDRQGRELGRFRGYRGEEPFWSELERMARP